MAYTQPRTFMLLPDKMHRPDDDIHLGTIIPLSKHTKLPDPDVPLNKYTRIIPSPSDMRDPLIEKPWVYNGGCVLSGSAGSHAEIPFAPVGGGFILGRSKEEKLVIQCDKVETTRFVPTLEYLRQAIAAEKDVQDYCRSQWFPSVYMVTGIKVAYNSNFESGSTLSYNAGLDASIDATTQGAPVNISLSPELNVSENGRLHSGIEDAFILAYQLKRLKMRRNSTLKRHGPFNKHSIFDDSDDGHWQEIHRTTLTSFLDDWEEDDVTSITVHNI